MEYKHLFFDLDRTLWDFERNSSETLNELYILNDLHSKGVLSAELFIQTYKAHNESLWVKYREGQIEKDELRTSRFDLSLQEFGINNKDLANQIGQQYISSCPLKTHLFPNTVETLIYLKKKYDLHIITNGFEEVQYIKLEQSNLLHFFDQVITSEQLGCKKPDSKIFKHALLKAFAQPYESLMIGDDLPVDILGAKNVGIDQVYFNPNKTEHKEILTFEIHSLNQLTDIL